MKEIKAKEGMFLTQVDDVGDNRIFITALKGANINKYDWRDATLEEKDEWEKAQEEKPQD